MTDEQAFHHAYRLFADALDILTRPPEEQCRLMCNFCVPTKLKQDIQAGEFLVGAGYLTAEQEAAIQLAVRAVDAVPSWDLPCEPGLEVNVRAMRHPCWEPIRILAARVQRTLALFSDRNAAYLRGATRSNG